MESKVKLDIDEEGNSIIVLDCVHSEDVRDKLANRFRERFGGASNWCEVEFSVIGSTVDRDLRRLVIRPVPLDQLKIHSELMALAVSRRQPVGPEATIPSFEDFIFAKYPHFNNEMKHDQYILNLEQVFKDVNEYLSL